MIFIIFHHGTVIYQYGLEIKILIECVEDRIIPILKIRIKFFYVSIMSVEYGYFFVYKKASVSPLGDKERNRPMSDSGGALRMKASLGVSPISSQSEP